MSYKTSMDVNIGYPSRSLLVDNPEINSPIFSTSIGLLLLGYTTDKEKEREKKPKKEMVEEELENEFELSENEIDKIDLKRKDNLISKFKENLFGFFEDKGSTM
jgi:cell division ATPase FtsA